MNRQKGKGKKRISQWGNKKAGYGRHELQSDAVTRRDLFHNQH